MKTNKEDLEGPTIEKSKVYDFLFIGLGASNSLILLSLLKKKCLSNKKVAIIEVDGKDTNDKTYCFWAAPSDSIVLELAPIISHSYTKIEVNQSTSQNIEDQPYHYIKSIDLYNYTQAQSTKLINLNTTLTSNSGYWNNVLDFINLSSNKS